MALDAHLCTGLFLQPKDGLRKKEAAEGKTKVKAGKYHRLLISPVSLERQVIKDQDCCQVNS
jgi:hypothetical protein